MYRGALRLRSGLGYSSCPSTGPELPLFGGFRTGITKSEMRISRW